jgi:hypothetical protein
MSSETMRRSKDLMEERTCTISNKHGGHETMVVPERNILPLSYYRV